MNQLMARILAGATTSLLILSSSIKAQATEITLDFQGLQNEEAVETFYDGGSGSEGSVFSGPNYGITFGDDALALISAQVGGGGGFDTAGVPGGDSTILFFLNGSGDVLNDPAGFTTGFSFDYSSPFYTGAVTVYSGLNSTGTVLATITLPETPNGETYGSPCSGDYSFCPFESAGVSFSGTAESVNFSGTANEIGFDNITLGSSTPGIPGSSVPEPSSILGSALLLISLPLLKIKYTSFKKAKNQA